MISYLDTFQEYLKNRKAPLTTKHYLHSIERFLSFLKGQEPNELNAKKFLIYLSCKGCGVRSVNRHLAALKSFFKYVVRKELVIESYRFDKKLPEWLDEDEQRKCLAACRTPFEKALVMVFLTGGLRVSEAANLNVADVDPAGYLRVMGKGEVERVAAVPSQAIDAINEYLRHRVQHSTKVFPRGVRAIQKTVKEIGERARISKEVTPRVLRHSYTNILLSKGFDLAEVRERLRHKNLVKS